MKDNVKFIIVGLPKTGKTMICDSLNRLSDFTVYDEIFVSHLGSGKMPDHPLQFMNEIRKRNRRNCFVAWYQIWHKTDISNITDFVNNDDVINFLDYTFSKDKNVGFKLHHHHIEVFPYILEYIKAMGIKVIRCDRNDILKQAVAILGNRDRITFTKERITLNVNMVKSYINDIKWRSKELTEWFDGLKLIYEDLTNDEHITELDVTKIREYLNVDIPSTISVRTVKNTFSKIEDNVINYEELNELSEN